MFRRTYFPALLAAVSLTAFAAYGDNYQARHGHRFADTFPTATPIKHLVVIYNENVSFDH